VRELQKEPSKLSLTIDRTGSINWLCAFGTLCQLRGACARSCAQLLHLRMLFRQPSLSSVSCCRSVVVWVPCQSCRPNCGCEGGRPLLRCFPQCCSCLLVIFMFVCAPANEPTPLFQPSPILLKYSAYIASHCITLHHIASPIRQYASGILPGHIHPACVALGLCILPSITM